MRTRFLSTWQYSKTNICKFFKYRVVQIIRAHTDSCRSRPWLDCWPASGPLYSRFFQTLTLLFQFIFPVDGHVETLAFADWLFLYVSAVSLVIVIIAICDLPRQEFSLCERVYIHNTYYIISVILLLFVQTAQILQFPVINVLDIFWGFCSNLSPISFNVSSVRTWRGRLTFLFFTEPVSLNLLACLLTVLRLGTGRPGNFIRNLRRVSEHDFLLFI